MEKEDLIEGVGAVEGVGKGVWEKEVVPLPGPLKLPIVVKEGSAELEEPLEAEILLEGDEEAEGLLEGEVL